MEQSELFLRFGTAIALGFLVGIQREHAHGGEGRKVIAGERTLGLSGLAGGLAAYTADLLDSALAYVVIVFLLGLFAVVAYYLDASRGQIGLTTEIAVVIVIIIGSLCYWVDLTLPIALGIATTVLLSLKVQTDRFVRALTKEDISAALQLAVITAIVLPVLPNEGLLDPPFDVLNPFKIWLMVVFISGISFLGYVLHKVVGAEQGIGLTGLLGGMVSSTAVTLSFSERSNRDKQLAKPFALAITVAWTVMFARVLIEVWVVNPALLKEVWLPIISAALAGLLYGAYLFIAERSAEKGDVEFSNPFDLGSAIKFGLLYGVILLVTHVAQDFGDTGVYLSSVLAGLADVDAITLSMAELTLTGGLAHKTAAQSIVLAAMSNTVVKSGIVLMGGSAGLKKALLPGVALILLVGISVAFI